MNLIPVKMKYTADVKGHALCVNVEYFELYRIFDFYFDNKKVSSKTVQNSSDTLYQNDDVKINEMIKEYCENKKDIFTDIFVRHADSVKLISKELQLKILDGFVELIVDVIVKENLYNISTHTKDNTGKFTGEFVANSFSEVLEKLRLFSGVLGDSNKELGKYIDSFSHDNIKEKYEWIDE